MAVLESESAVQAVLERHRPRFLALLRGFRIPEQDAADLLQNVLVRYVQKHRTIENPDAWLPQVMRRECLMYLRAKRRRFWEMVDSALLEVASQPPNQEAARLRCDLESAIRELSPKCRELLRLRYVMGCTDREVGSEMGYEESSISKLAKRCVAALEREITRLDGKVER